MSYSHFSDFCKSSGSPGIMLPARVLSAHVLLIACIGQGGNKMSVFSGGVKKRLPGDGPSVLGMLWKTERQRQVLTCNAAFFSFGVFYCSICQAVWLGMIRGREFMMNEEIFTKFVKFGTELRTPSVWIVSGEPSRLNQLVSLCKMLAVEVMLSLSTMTI